MGSAGIFAAAGFAGYLHNDNDIILPGNFKMSTIKTIKEWADSQARKKNTAKGDAFEERVEAFLQARGWVVERTKMNRRMIVRRGRSAWITVKADFWGCIDFIALSRDRTVLIQATSSQDLVKTKQKEINSVIPDSACRGLEIWTPGIALNDFKVWHKCNVQGWGGPWSARELYGPSL